MEMLKTSKKKSEETIKTKKTQSALAGVAQWIECQPANQRAGGLGRARAWVVGQVPSRQPHIDVSLPSPLSKNK